MSGYTRVEEVSTARSKSIDISDLAFLPKTPKPLHKHSSNPPDSKTNHDKRIPEKNIDIRTPIQENGNEDGVGEIFGVILNKARSVSSASSRNFCLSDQKQNASFQSAVKRVLSMKRSSSVSEGYRRIHHQCDPAAGGDDDESAVLAFKKSSTKKKGKFFRACRRIFGF